MKIYNYNAITKEFAGESQADLSPLDKKQGREVWLIPANATTVEPPPASPDKIRIFNNDNWELLDREGV